MHVKILPYYENKLVSGARIYVQEVLCGTIPDYGAGSGWILISCNEGLGLQGSTLKIELERAVPEDNLAFCGLLLYGAREDGEAGMPRKVKIESDSTGTRYSLDDQG